MLTGKPLWTLCHISSQSHGGCNRCRAPRIVSSREETTLLQYSCLENPMDRGAWWAVVHGVAGSRTRLSDFTFPSHFHALEKEMATHSSVLAWRIPGTGKPGGLPSMGSHRVGHDWSDLAAAAAATTATAERKHWILANLSYSHPINGKKWMKTQEKMSILTSPKSASFQEHCESP